MREQTCRLTKRDAWYTELETDVLKESVVGCTAEFFFFGDVEAWKSNREFPA